MVGFSSELAVLYGGVDRIPIWMTIHAAVPMALNLNSSRHREKYIHTPTVAVCVDHVDRIMIEVSQVCSWQAKIGIIGDPHGKWLCLSTSNAGSISVVGGVTTQAGKG